MTGDTLIKALQSGNVPVVHAELTLEQTVSALIKELSRLTEENNLLRAQLFAAHTRRAPVGTTSVSDGAGGRALIISMADGKQTIVLPGLGLMP